MHRKTVLLWLILALLAGGAYVHRVRLAAWFAGKAAGVTSAAGIHHAGDKMVPATKRGEAAAPADKRKVLYWVDLMHPAYKSDKPGIAPDCGMELVPVYADESKELSEFPPGTVEISAQKQQLIGVTLDKVGSEPLVRTIRAVGKLTYDETKIARIHTKVDGWIENVYVDFTGKFVQKNQPLISIYSPELVSAQQELLIARKASASLGQSPFQEISSGASSLLEASRARLRLWDISEEQIKELEQRGTAMKTLTLYSPADGFVIARNAFAKQRITPETELYAIADLSTIWVLADVYEYEAPMIRLGQTAAMTLSYFPGEKFKGTVSYIYPQLDNTTRTLKVRLEFPNGDFRLKPEMYADVELQIDYGRQLSVPEEAVLDSGSEQIVFVARGGGYFEPRKVQLGAKVDRRFIVLSGLRQGEEIVTSGNFLIDSESRLKSAMAAMAGMGHGGEAPAAGGKPQPGATPGQPQRPGKPPEDHSSRGKKP